MTKPETPKNAATPTAPAAVPTPAAAPEAVELAPESPQLNPSDVVAASVQAQADAQKKAAKE